MSEVNEKLSENDPDNPRFALNSVQKRQIPTTYQGKVVYIPYDRTKFICPFHKIRLTINMSDNAIRDKKNKMIEFECDCHTIYIRTQNNSKVSPEWQKYFGN